jgi:hypothetical protein
MPRLLSQVQNFGPAAVKELGTLGLTTLEQLIELGFDGTCRAWVERYPGRLNVDAFVGVLTALEDTPRARVSASQRTRAQAKVVELEHERDQAILGPR